MNGNVGLFETIRVFQGHAEFLDRHARRMERSARFLTLSFSKSSFLHVVSESAGNCSGPHPWRLRIDRIPEESLTWKIRVSVLPELPQMVSLRVGSDRVDHIDERCQHKTTFRGIYSKAQRDAEKAGFWDSILLNREDYVAETGRANIYVWDGQKLYTPPVSAGVLPGVVRQVLIEKGLAGTKDLFLDDLARAEGVFVSNALIGIAAVSKIDGLKDAPDPNLLSDLLRRFRSACHPHWI